MHRTRRFLVVGLIVVALMLLFAAWRATHRVPRYAGKTLYEWISELESSDPLSKPFHANVVSRRERAQAAIRQIGTNALPFLMADLQANFTLKDTAYVWLSRLPFLNVQVPSTVQDRWVRGIRGMEVLGPLAKPWLPDLTAMATNNIDTGPWALLAVGPDALPAVTNLLTSSGFPAKLYLIIALEYGVSEDRIKPEEAVAAVPALLNALRSRDSYLWIAAARALGTIHQQPELCIPALADAVPDSSRDLRSEGITALGRFGRHATNAMPLLERACSDPDESVRTSASNALRQIERDLRPE